jgi:hypothetical protein
MAESSPAQTLPRPCYKSAHTQVNVDCTISASIIDIFTPPQEFYFGPAQASATFQEWWFKLEVKSV